MNKTFVGNAITVANPSGPRKGLILDVYEGRMKAERLIELRIAEGYVLTALAVSPAPAESELAPGMGEYYHCLFALAAGQV